MNEGKIPITNIYYLLCYAWSHVEEGDVVRLEELGGLERVHDLLGKVLAEGTFRLIRRASIAATGKCARTSPASAGRSPWARRRSGHCAPVDR